MLCTRNQYGTVGKLFFKNKIIEKEIRYVVTKDGTRGRQSKGQISSYK